MDKELKTLLESYHVATLRQMAEIAGLNVKQPGSRKNLNKTDLHALILKEFFTPQRIAASLEELDTRERAVLDRLLLRGGETTTRSLKRELERAKLIGKTPSIEKQRRSYYSSNAGTYGMDVYEGDPKKRHSRIFEDIIARLTRFGLVFSKNPPSTSSASTPYKLKFHPANQIFIPSAIRRHLPQPAPIPDEKETWQPARVLPGDPTLFLRDLYLYWDFVRRRPIKLLNAGYVGKRDLKALNAVLLQPDQGLSNAKNETETPKLHLLRLLLENLNLLEVQRFTLRPSNSDARKIPTFWTQSTPEQVRDVLHTWMPLTDYNFQELGHKARQYNPDYAQGRRNIIVALKKYARKDWTHQDLFLEELQDHNKDFLFSSHSQVESSRKGYYSSYIGGHYFYGSRSDLLQTFEKLETKFINYLLQNILHALGIVDLAYGPGAEEKPAFKLTALGKTVLGVDAAPTDKQKKPPAADTGKVILQPNFHLLAMGPVSLSTLAWLDLFAERQRADIGAFEYQITRDSVYRAQQLEMSADSIMQWLKQATGQALPQNVQRTLQEWGAHHQRIVFRSGVSLLQAANANLLEDLLETYQTGRYLNRALTPEVALIKKGKDNALVSALIDRDILPAVSGDQPQSADHSVHIEADGTITPVHAVPSLHLRGRLARLAEEKNDGRWQLTPASARKSGGSKVKVLKMLDELKRLNRGDLPDTVLTQVKAWGGYYGNAALETLTLIEFRDPEIMAELMQRPDLKGLLTPFSVEKRALAVIAPEKAGAIQDTLIKLGMRIKDSLPR